MAASYLKAIGDNRAVRADFVAGKKSLSFLTVDFANTIGAGGPWSGILDLLDRGLIP
jgi:hypothetical protein